MLGAELGAELRAALGAELDRALGAELGAALGGERGAALGVTVPLQARYHGVRPTVSRYRTCNEGIYSED